MDELDKTFMLTVAIPAHVYYFADGSREKSGRTIEEEIAAMVEECIDYRLSISQMQAKLRNLSRYG